MLKGQGSTLGANDSLDRAALADRYVGGGLTPTRVVTGVLERIAARGDDGVWISVFPREELLAEARRLEAAGPVDKPLFGIPFAIKDCLDLAGYPTTVGCPAFAYRPERTATAVQRLIDAGAIAVGKTNLDQFATGLNGTRSPYGVPGSALAPAYIAGGSSSGSAVAVAAGLVSFALGSDTAGSGRVPAQFNNIVGLKPSRGVVSTAGVFPACRSIDCLSIFALSADDARDVFAVVKGFDPADPFSRREMPTVLHPEVKGTRFGVPRPADLEFFGNSAGQALFAAMAERIAGLGGELVEIDLSPFLAAARLLYDGPWVAERYLAIRDLIEQQPEALHPVTRAIIARGGTLSAADAFAAQQRLRELSRMTEAAWTAMDVLVTPTAPRQYTIAEMLADPIRLNNNLGTYTNFVNLLDLAAIAIPAGFQDDGLPFGVTLVGPAFSDAGLLALGDGLHRAQDLPLGALPSKLPAKRAVPPSGVSVRLAVCGAHMAGLPLNHQLTERGARLLRACRTAPSYRLYALPGGPPARPGMVRDAAGSAIEVEVWEVPTAQFGSFVAAIPAPLAIGTVELEDGEMVKGFVCEAHALHEAREITELGGWRRYLAVSGQAAASQGGNRMAVIRAEPYEFRLDPTMAALVIIDMQRDFVEPGGFGEALGNDVSRLQKAVPPTRRLLEAARKAGLYVIHTREGHRPDLADLWPAKKERGRHKTTIGDPGPMGRILVRGEYGHDIIDELKPRSGEAVVDKPGKGAFYATDLDEILKSRGIKQLIVCGVTTEVCVNTTVREANDRGYDCLVLEDCVASYFPEFHDAALKMIKAQGGIFGWVSSSSDLLPVLARIGARKRQTQPPARRRARA